MMNRRWATTAVLMAAVSAGAWLLFGAPAGAHCDTLDGPVVRDARAALSAGEAAPALKWVRAEHENEVREVFRHALAVRKASPAARDMADRLFFETLVRLHRAGEGEPYTGLKPAGINPGPAVTGADRALESGSVDALASQLSEEVSVEIRRRFTRAYEARKHKDDSVRAGREYVEAYVEFVHHAEKIHAATTGTADSHHGGQAITAPGDAGGE